MLNSELIQKVLFDFDSLGREEIIRLVENLPNKLKRWLGANHPDARTRKIFFRLTNVRIGSRTVINQNFIVSDDYQPLLTIGNRVAISPNVTVICVSNPNNSSLQRHSYVIGNLACSKEVIIEDDVWVGAGAIILPGVVIGHSSIIGAGSVVAQSVPPSSIVAGVPAKVIRCLENESDS